MNFYENKNYYNYKHPITKRLFYIGSDRETAIKEAEQINWSLMPKSELVIASEIICMKIREP